MQATNDMDLLREYVKNGSEQAFAELVSQHIGMVYAVALRHTANPSHAEEITQAVFIILAKKASQLSRRTVFSGWLFQTARLTAANFMRTEMRRQRREQEAYMQSLSNDPETDPWPQIAPLLDQAIASLGDKDRNAIVLRFLEGKDLRTVGEVLGASEDAAKVRVHRALDKLRGFFLSRGVGVPTAVLGTLLIANSSHAAPAGLAAGVAALAAIQGTGAAASTLGLIKTTLKLMAWTKLKTTAVVAAGLLIATGTTTYVTHRVAQTRADEDAIWNTQVTSLVSLPPLVRIRKSPVSATGVVRQQNQVVLTGTNSPLRGQLPQNMRFSTNGGSYSFVMRTNTGVSNILNLIGGSQSSLPTMARSEALTPGERCLRKGMSMPALLSLAYGASEVDARTPLPQGAFDLIVTTPDPATSVQAELKKQFKLAGRTEEVDREVLILKVKSTNVPGLKPSSSFSGQTTFSSSSTITAKSTQIISVSPQNNEISVKNLPISMIVRMLAKTFDKQIIDETGLRGPYDIDFKVPAGATDEEKQAALTAQTGLEVTSEIRPIKRLIVQKAK